jgi:hypothetical protein
MDLQQALPFYKGKVWTYNFNIHNCVSDQCYMYSVWLQTGRPGFNPRQKQWIFPLASVFRLALGYTQLPVQMGTTCLFPGVKRGRGMMLTTDIHLVQRLRMSRSCISSPPSTSMACSGTAVIFYHARYMLICLHIVTYSGFSIHDGTSLHSKSQYTAVKHSRKLFEHTDTSDPYGPGALIPIGSFQQDLLWQSSNTHSHSCSQKVSKHTPGQSIVGLSVHLHTTTALRRIVHH